LAAKLEMHRADARGLESQVVAIGEEVRRKDEARRQELLACEEALQQVTISTTFDRLRMTLKCYIM